jgi:dsDNA-specific endonuclease/ATPase MutS2
MDNQPFKALEYDQILELLKGFATSSVGKALCEGLKPQRKLSWIKRRLGEVDELKKIMEVYGEIPLAGIEDVRKVIARAKIEGAVLSTEEILDILGNMRVSLGLKSSFKKLKGDLPAIAPQGAHIGDCSDNRSTGQDFRPCQLGFKANQIRYRRLSEEDQKVLGRDDET